MKKVLLITYYWPPSGGAGVQRVLKTVKYLRSFGWEPVVYTAKNAAYPIVDESLWYDVPEGQKILFGDIWEPYELYKKFTQQGKKERVYSGFLAEDKKLSLTQRIAIWVRGNLFIPDARKFWIKPSIKYLVNWLKTNHVDAIISSGPPHTVHMIAKGVKIKTGLRWLADFRDPWTNIDFYDQLMLTKWADRKHHRMEKEVLDQADKISTVSWTWAREYEELAGKKVDVVTNGFDDADFESKAPELTEKFVCSHIGYLNADRNSPHLWKAFGQLAQEIEGFKDDLELRFIGKTDHIAFAQIESEGLKDCLKIISYIPHSEVLKYTRSTQILLLLVNNVPNVMGHIPGKTYEYIGSGRPIVAIGKTDADFARIISETQSGLSCNFEDLEAMKEALRKYYYLYKDGKLKLEQRHTEKYTRKFATSRIASLLDKLNNNE